MVVITVPAKKKALPRSQWLELYVVSPVGFTPAFTASTECWEDKKKKKRKKTLLCPLITDNFAFQANQLKLLRSCFNTYYLQINTFYVDSQICVKTIFFS